MAAATMTLDRGAALDAIADLWRLCPEEPASWRLDRFGPDLAGSLENLATVVFSPQRELVAGPPVEVRVYPVADSHAQPLLVCVAAGDGPMLCRGIEDLTRALPDPWGASPETVLDALQLLLDFAAAILAGARERDLDRPEHHWDPAVGSAGREPIHSDDAFAALGGAMAHPVTQADGALDRARIGR